MQKILLVLLAALLTLPLTAQQINTENPYDLTQNSKGSRNDSTETTDVPVGLYVWNVGERFGDIRPAQYDTIPHRFQNENFTDGSTGHYNFTGNLGAPRISRHFIEQGANMQSNPFLFFLPYDYFLTSPSQLLFTNTKSPFTTLTYHSCGNKTNGEDRLKAAFSVNAGKRLGLGFNADYLYGRGYYEGQSTADLNAILYASYRGERYQLHLYGQHTYLKTRENGGIENDDYVNRPESFPTRYGTGDMPINLARAWNRLGGKQIFLTQRYSLGFRRYRDAKGNVVKSENLPKLWGVASNDSTRNPQTLALDSIHPSLSPLPAAQASVSATDSVKEKTALRIPRLPRGIDKEEAGAEKSKEASDSLRITSEFIPVSSFIHTFRFNTNHRRFISNEQNDATNAGYFSPNDFYLAGDSANDYTTHISVENTLAIELHEGFNRWMKMGLRLYGKHEFASFKFEAPHLLERTAHTHFKENYITVGAQLLSQQSRIIRYNLLGELRTTGTDWGEFNVEGDARLSIPLRRDSLHFNLEGFIRNERPSFYYRHYYARNAWWDNNGLDKQFRARVVAALRYRSTRLTASLENIQNYTFFQETLTPYTASDGYVNYYHAIGVAQASKNVQLFGLTLNQDFAWGIFHWENELTYQATTNKDVYPLPAFTGYTNLYLLFRIAKVLRTELGADLRYFTRYYAPAYSPIIGLYATQDANYRTKVGNYPTINVYANFHLKRTRFYLMVSHVNYSSGAGNPFLVPHYPLNRLVIRMGLSWNFIN